MTKNESFTNDAASGFVSYPAGGATPIARTGGENAVIAYDATAHSYALAADSRSFTFLPGDVSAEKSSDQLSVYLRTVGDTTDMLTLTRPGTSGALTYRYVGGAFWQRTSAPASGGVSNALDALTFGVETAPTAVPRTGSVSYPVGLLGAMAGPSSVATLEGEGQVDVDFAQGVLVTRGMLTHGPADAANIATGSGGAPFAFEGYARLSSSADSFAGEFRVLTAFGSQAGRFYGPAGEEIGASFSVTDHDGRVAVGSVIGRAGDAMGTGSSFAALDASQFFANDAVVLNAALEGSSGSNLGTQSFSSRSTARTPETIHYDAATRRYTLVSPTDDLILEPAMLVPGNGIVGNASDTTPGTDLDGIAYPALQDLQYVRSLRWQVPKFLPGGSAQYQINDMLYGFQTAKAGLPRTGKAGYAIGLTGVAADAQSPNLTQVSGFGFLTANFGNGTITASGQTVFGEELFSSGRDPNRAGGPFSLSATMTSGSNAFAGTISLTGNSTYTGDLLGHFFGPAAQEVGGSFTANDGTGNVLTGTLAGGLDNAVSSTVLPINDQASPVTFTMLDSKPSGMSALFGDLSSVKYDPGTHGYTLTFADASTVTLGTSNRDTVASDASYSQFFGRQSGGSNRNFVARQLRPVSTNPTLALSYLSFVDVSADPPVDDPRGYHHYALFGLATPSYAMPRGGTATYNGIARGAGIATADAGTSSSSNSAWIVSGNATVAVDFVHSHLDSTLTLVSIDAAGNVPPPANFGPITASGAISQARFHAIGSGAVFDGQFFGPNAEELGATFSLDRTDTAGTRYQLNGIIAARR